MRYRVLLADGDPGVLRGLDVSLRKSGFDVQTATNGHDAWAALQASVPDLVLADAELGDMSGFELCARLRGSSGATTVPFIMLSSDATLEQRMRSVEVGADDYFLKPLVFDEAIVRLRALLQRLQKNQPANSANARPETLRAGQEQSAAPAVADDYPSVGDLADVSVIDLVQLVETNRRSGIAHLQGPSGTSGSVYFRRGAVVDAEVGKLSGIDALSRLFAWNAGTFEFEWKNIRRPDVVNRPSKELVFEEARRLEEWNRLSAELDDLNAVLEVDYLRLAERLAAIPDEVNSILRLCDGARTIMQVVEDAGMPDAEALTAIIRLRDEKIVAARSVPPKTESAASPTGRHEPVAATPRDASAIPPAEAPWGDSAAGAVDQSFAQQPHKDDKRAERGKSVEDFPAGSEEAPVGATRRRTAPGLGHSRPGGPSVGMAAVSVDRDPDGDEGQQGADASEDSPGRVIRFPVSAAARGVRGAVGVFASAARDGNAARERAAESPTPAPAASALPHGEMLSHDLNGAGAAAPLSPGGHVRESAVNVRELDTDAAPVALASMGETHRGFGPVPTSFQTRSESGVPLAVRDQASTGEGGWGGADGVDEPSYRGSQTGRTARDVPVVSGSDDAPSKAPRAGGETVRVAFTDDAMTQNDALDELGLRPGRGLRIAIGAVVVGACVAVGVRGFRAQSGREIREVREQARAEKSTPTPLIAENSQGHGGTAEPKSPIPAPAGERRRPVSGEAPSERGPADPKSQGAVESTPASPSSPVTAEVALPSSTGGGTRDPHSAAAAPNETGSGAAPADAITGKPVGALAARPAGAAAPPGPSASPDPGPRAQMQGATAALDTEVAVGRSPPGGNLASALAPAPSTSTVVNAPVSGPAASGSPVGVGGSTGALSDIDTCRQAIARGRIRQAVASCEAAVAANPRSAQALTMLAHTELNRGHLARANELATKALAIDPNVADAYVIMGGVHQDSGQSQQAKAAYLRYLQLAPRGRYAAELRSIVQNL